MKYRYDFTWHPEPRRTIHIRGEWQETRELSNSHFLRDLKELRYTFPRWWQYWRWGEKIPSIFAKPNT